MEVDIKEVCGVTAKQQDFTDMLLTMKVAPGVKLDYVLELKQYYTKEVQTSKGSDRVIK